MSKNKDRALFFRNKWSSSKSCYGHVDCGFDNPAEQVRRNAEQFFSIFENDNGIFLQEKIYSQKVPTNLFNAVSKTLSEIYGQKVKNFSLNVRKLWINNFFQKQMICLKMFLWWRWLRFSKPDRTSSKNSRVVLTKFPKKIT